MSIPLVTITVTLYRSSEDLRVMLPRLAEFANRHRTAFEVECIFVSDRSPDDSVAYLRRELPRLSAFRSELHVLSRNFGATYALRCAMAHGHGDYFAPIPPDLQDPPELIPTALRQLEETGAHVCLGIPERRRDGRLAGLCSGAYWALYGRLFGAEFPRRGLGFFLLDRKARDILLGLGENTSFLFGLMFWMGLDKTYLKYEKSARERGESAWSFRKKLSYFLDSVFSFSTRPIRALTVTGLLMLVVAVASKSIVLVFGALNMIGMGVLGEYVVRILANVQGRPNFIVEESYRFAGKPKRLRRAA